MSTRTPLSLLSLWPLGVASLLVLGDVVSVWSVYAGHWSAVIRPAAVVVAIAALLVLLGVAATRSTGVGTGVGLSATAVLLGLPLTALGATVAIAWAVVVRWRSLRRRRGPEFPKEGLFALAVLLLVVGVSEAVIGGAIVPGDLHTSSDGPAAAGTDLPSIYVIMLDGYPRVDTLRDEFDFDNEPFIAGLERLGFTHYPDATSPSARTELTLLSMMGREVDETLPPEFSSNIAERRQVRRDLAAAPALASLRLARYELIHIASPVIHVTPSGWDRYLDTGQVNELEAALLQRSLVGPLLADWVIVQQRERIASSMTLFTSLAGERGSKVGFLHVMAPHPPFLSGSLPCWRQRQCNLLEVRPDNLQLSANAYATLFSEQVEQINALTLEALTVIVEHDPAATVVVMSDHGARHTEQRDEWRRSLLAVRGTEALDHERSVRDLFSRLLDSP